jgi:hypothetical protein
MSGRRVIVQPGQVGVLGIVPHHGDAVPAPTSDDLIIGVKVATASVVADRQQNEEGSAYATLPGAGLLHQLQAAAQLVRVNILPLGQVD